jgi:hypothetical protein
MQRRDDEVTFDATVEMEADGVLETELMRAYGDG